MESSTCNNAGTCEDSQPVKLMVLAVWEVSIVSSVFYHLEYQYGNLWFRIQKQLKNMLSWTCARNVAPNLWVWQAAPWSVCVEGDNQTLSQPSRKRLCVHVPTVVQPFCIVAAGWSCLGAAKLWPKYFGRYNGHDSSKVSPNVGWIALSNFSNAMTNRNAPLGCMLAVSKPCRWGTKITPFRMIELLVSSKLLWSNVLKPVRWFLGSALPGLVWN